MENKIKAVVIDDEPAAIDVIVELCRQLTADVEVVGTAKNSLEAIRLIQDLQRDLLFLDIDMPQMRGTQMLDKLPHRNFEVVFTTGSSSYALVAIMLHADDYLL